MKDFAKTSRPCRKFKSMFNDVRKGIYWAVCTINKIFRIVLRLLLISLCAIGVLFIILPHVISFNFNKNLLFYQYDNNGQISQIYFAFLKFDANQIEVYQLPLTYSSQLLNMQERAIDEVTIEQSLDRQSTSRNLDGRGSTWLTGRVVAQTFEIPSEINIKQADDLGQAVSRQALTLLKNRQLSDLMESIKLMLFMRRTQWQGIHHLQQKPLPVTAVLPSDCPVAVINTTGISRLAATTSLILEKSGARVIRVDSNGQQLKQTQLIVSDDNDRCLPVVDALTNQVLFGEISRESNAEQQQLLNRYRANIVLLLGNTELDGSE